MNFCLCFSKYPFDILMERELDYKDDRNHLSDRFPCFGEATEPLTTLKTIRIEDVIAVPLKASGRSIPLVRDNASQSSGCLRETLVFSLLIESRVRCYQGNTSSASVSRHQSCVLGFQITAAMWKLGSCQSIFARKRLR